MIMAQKILNFNVNPIVKTYNHHAFGIGIVTSIPQGINWVYNNYIILSYYRGGGVFTFDFYMDYIYCQPIFDREHLSDEMMAIMKWDAIDFIKEAINCNKYVVTCVNEYYIPDREAYMSCRFVHNLIIYGYDDNKKIFYIAGYNDKNKYVTQEVSFKNIKLAKPRNITLLTLRNDFDYRVALHYIAHQIDQYNGKEFPDPIGSYPEKNRLIGIEAVNCLMDDITTFAVKGEVIDVRPICLLYEQRMLMLQRLKYLECNIPNEFDEQVHLCESFKNRVYMYNMRNSEKDRVAVLRLCEELRNAEIPKLI